MMCTNTCHEITFSLLSLSSGLREEDSIPASALKTRADLENCIQASPKELSAALEALGAIVHNGKLI
jgi:hypothetical protein